MALTLVALAGTLRNPDGTLANGSIDFELTQPLVDAVGGVVTDTGPVSMSVTNGVYAISLYANDCVGVTPPGTVYKLTKKLIVGQLTPSIQVVYATVPMSLAGGGAGLDDLTYIAGVGGALDLATHAADSTLHGTGRELGYAETTADMSIAGSAIIDVPGLTTTIQAIGKPISVEWGGFLYASANAFTVYLDLYMDGAQIGRTGATLPLANGVDAPIGHKRIQPAAGSHVLKVRLYSFSGGGTGHALGGASFPLTLSAVEHP